jgi:hypothetical protein
MNRELPGIALLLFLGCGASTTLLTACGGASYAVTVSTSKPTPAKPLLCDFQIVNLPPASGYEEIATLTPKGDVAYNPVDFKRLVQPLVCSVGGDLVVTEVNGLAYVRGTVMRKVP